jgi:hypothetical protein
MGVVAKIDTVIASETSRLRTDECHEAMLTSMTIRRREGALPLLDGDRRQKREDAQIDRFAHVHRGRAERANALAASACAALSARRS